MIYLLSALCLINTGLVIYFYLHLRVLRHDFGLAMQSLAKLNPQDVASASQVAAILLAHQEQFRLHSAWQQAMTEHLQALDRPLPTGPALQ